MMKSLALLLALCTCVQAEKILVVDGDRYTVIDTDTGKGYRINKVITIGDAPTNPTSDGTLTSWVTARTKAVPAHKYREETAEGLASAYLGLAKAWREKRVKELNVLLQERKRIHDTFVAALGVANQWAGFDADLVDELTRRKLKPADVAKALEDVAAGLTAGKAINPAVIKAGFKLVMALLSKDQQAIRQAISELVLALISGVGS